MQQKAENETEGEGNVQNDIVNKEEQKKGSWMRLLDGRLVALFVLGILIGVTVKTQALKTMTMGFDDYRLKNTTHDFSLAQKQTQEAETEEQIEEPDQAEVEIENEEE